MDIAVLGTGMVGQALAGAVVRLGHSVVVGTRDPAATLARTAPDGIGNPPFASQKRRNAPPRVWPLSRKYSRSEAAGFEVRSNRM